jgi:hypothetical protein
VTGPRVLPRAVRGVREKDLESFVKETAGLFGWERYHTHRSDFSPSGWPDETLCRPPRMVIAELKSEMAWRKKDHGCSPEQLRWHAKLRACPGIEFYLWQPADADDIVRILR